MWRTSFKFLLPFALLIGIFCIQACDNGEIVGVDAPAVQARVELPPGTFMANPGVESTATFDKRPEVKMVPFANGYIYWDGNWEDVDIGCSPDNPTPENSILGKLFWVGNMPHLGKVVVDQLLCFDFDLGSIAWMDWTANAANGDQMKFELTGATAEVPPEGWDHIGHQNILGGTGRFENAEGWFDWAWKKDCPEMGCPEHLMIIRGEISSVGSTK